MVDVYHHHVEHSSFKEHHKRCNLKVGGRLHILEAPSWALLLEGGGNEKPYRCLSTLARGAVFSASLVLPKWRWYMEHGLQNSR